MSDQEEQVRWDIVLEVRKQYLSGHSVPELVAFLQNGLRLSRDQRLTVYRYLSECFKLPVSSLVRIGGWQGFSEGTQTDKEIDDILRPAIQAEEKNWLSTDS